MSEEGALGASSRRGGGTWPKEDNTDTATRSPGDLPVLPPHTVTDRAAGEAAGCSKQHRRGQSSVTLPRVPTPTRRQGEGQLTLRPLTPLGPGAPAPPGSPGVPWEESRGARVKLWHRQSPRGAPGQPDHTLQGRPTPSADSWAASAPVSSQAPPWLIEPRTRTSHRALGGSQSVTSTVTSASCHCHLTDQRGSQRGQGLCQGHSVRKRLTQD